jgi:Peptidase A4 family
VSAEWVVEGPGNRARALPNFGHIGFTSVTARDDTGVSGSLTKSSTWSRIRYQTEANGVRYVTTGQHSTNGASFGVDWVHA